MAGTSMSRVYPERRVDFARVVDDARSPFGPVSGLVAAIGVADSKRIAFPSDWTVAHRPSAQTYRCGGSIGIAVRQHSAPISRLSEATISDLKDPNPRASAPERAPSIARQRHRENERCGTGR
jgi:hypothetical protein